MKSLISLVITLFFAAALPLAHAGSPSSRTLNPQPLPPGKTMGSKVQVNPQPLPPQAGGQGAEGGGALIEGFATVTDRNIDRMNAIGTHTNERAAGRISVSKPARPATK